MAAESIYSALMEIKDVIGNGGSGSGSGSGCECESIVPVFEITGELGHSEITCNYTPTEFKEHLLAGKINACIVRAKDTPEDDAYYTFTTNSFYYENSVYEQIFVFSKTTDGSAIHNNVLLRGSVTDNIWSEAVPK